MFLTQGIYTTWGIIITIIIINVFIQRDKAVTSEVLGPAYREKEREKTQEKKDVFSLDFNTATESLLTTVFGSEFQTAGAEHR